MKKVNSLFGIERRGNILERDMTELSMIPKEEWTGAELDYFHRALQQMVPYLNEEGQSIHREIIKEIQQRGGLKNLL